MTKPDVVTISIFLEDYNPVERFFSALKLIILCLADA